MTAQPWAEVDTNQGGAMGVGDDTVACADCARVHPLFQTYRVSVPLFRHDKYDDDPFSLCPSCWDSICNAAAISRLR